MGHKSKILLNHNCISGECQSRGD